MTQHITSLQHPLVKHLVKLRQDRNYRYEQRTILVEGIKPVAEACHHCQPKVILATGKSLLPPLLASEKCYFVTEQVFQKVSGMQHPEGLLAEVPMPKSSSLKGMQSILVLDSINDPGNLGTLLRTALALGWEGAFLVGNCCDPFNEKVIRAARGACLKLPLAWGTWPKLKELAAHGSLIPLLADLNGDPPTAVLPPCGVMLILSNEAHGPSLEAQGWCKKVSIPLSGEIESLNVASAGAILMYNIRPLSPKS